MIKKVIYQCRIGSGYSFYEPLYINPDWDYLCFTDDTELVSEYYKIINVSSINGDNRRTAKKIKTLAHEYVSNYDISIYIGSEFKIRCDLNNLIKNNFSKNIDMACIRHNKRNCIYKEAKKIIKLGYDKKEIVQKQMKKYHEEGFPGEMGLAAFFIFIRWHNRDIVKNFMKQWYHEILEGSSRDLLSFNYVLWKIPLRIKYMSWKRYYPLFK